MAGIGLDIKLEVYNTISKTIKDRIRRPITSAAKTSAADLKIRGRQNIAKSGGKSGSNMGNIANAFRVNVYPERSESWHPSIFAYVNTQTKKNPEGYSKVFEEGATISGRPILWVPLPTARQIMGRLRIGPAEWSKRFGELTPIKANGKLLLVGSYSLNQRAIGSSKRKRLVARANKKKGYATQLTPLFVGVRQVRIKKYWGLKEIAAQESRKFRDLIIRKVSQNG